MPTGRVIIATTKKTRHISKHPVRNSLREPLPVYTGVSAPAAGLIGEEAAAEEEDLEAQGEEEIAEEAAGEEEDLSEAEELAEDMLEVEEDVDLADASEQETPNDFDEEL